MYRLLRTNQLILVGVGVAILFWIIESYLDTLVLDVAFTDRLIPEDPNELWMRLMIVGLLVGFSFYAQAIISKRRRAEEALREAQDELERRVGERTTELAQANEDLQTEAAERERAQETLRESEERYRLLVESIKDYAIFMVDTEGRVADWNAGAERVFGYREEEIVGESVSVIFTPEDVRQGAPEREREHALEEGCGEDERRHVRKDGTWFWASGFVRPVRDEAGNLRGFAKVARDITERKRAEDAQRFLARAGAELSFSLDYRATLRAVANLTVPDLADWCAVDIIEEDGSLERLAVAHQDPEKVALAYELQKRYPPDPEAPYGMPNVLRTGEAEMMAEIPEELLEQAARDEGAQGDLTGAGTEILHSRAADRAGQDAWNDLPGDG